MPIVHRAVTGALFVLFVVTAAIAEQPTSVAKKVVLQAAMQRHIESQLIDGAYLHLDPGSGAVRALYPVKAHPMTLKMGDYFVLCSDFRDAKGRPVNVDFYMAQRDGRYVVFHSAVDNRGLLERLMDKGDVKRFE